MAWFLHSDAAMANAAAPSAHSTLAPPSGTRKIGSVECVRPERARAEEEGSPVKPLRILVVDDDDASRRLLEALFLDAGFAVATASGGEQALAEASRIVPDLVLTDLQMPRVNGVELCRRLHEREPQLPVVVMTAHSDMQSVIDSLRAGAEDYLMKPLELDTTLWCVKRALARRADELAHEELNRTLNERLLLSSIREQEHADAEARQRAQLNRLLENLGEGVIIGDERGRVLLLNPAARTILGLGDADSTPAELSSLQAFELDGRPLPNARLPLARAVRGEEFTDYELLCARPTGERRRIVFTGTSVTNENGEVAMAIVVLRDVTEVRRLELQRDEYLALLSHDLRNPLNTILMSVSTLKAKMAKDGRSSEVSVAERAERSVGRMTTMLEELSEVARLESRGIELQRTTCDLADVVRGIVEGFDIATARRIELEVDGTPPYHVWADRSWLERVVVNLLTNALKYSPTQALVHVRLAHDGDAVELEVVDCGIGIDPESIKQLFDRYYRTAAGRATTTGSGLGLYIARLIVEAHGGHIDVSSEVGKGSRFKLVMPSEPAALSHADTTSA